MTVAGERPPALDHRVLNIGDFADVCTTSVKLDALARKV